MDNNLKVNLSHMNSKVLMSFVTMNEEMRRMYAESETFEPLQKFIDDHFIYTEEQLQTIKTKFIKSR